ncbi:lysostaphin resistance A-like protein [candidate division KSB1 bacterium]
MRKGILSDLSPLSKLFFTLFIIVVSFLLLALIGALLAIPLFGVNFFTNPDLLDVGLYPESIQVVKYFQIIQSLGIFILPPLTAALLFSTQPFHYLKINQQPLLYSFIVSGIIIIASMPLIEYMIQVNEKLILPEFLSSMEQWMKKSEEGRKEITLAFLNVDSVIGFAVNIFMFGILAAVGEELLFRGIIQRLLSDWLKNNHWAIIVAAFLFSALHMQFYGFLPRFILGVFLGYLFLWTRSLWIPIFAHFINNASAVTVYYLANIGILKIDPEDFGSVDSKFLFFASVMLVFGLLVTIYLKEKTRRTNTITLNK